MDLTGVADFLKDVLGNGTGILAMLGAFALIKKSVEGIEGVGSFISSVGNAKAPVKRAQEEADFLKNKRTEAALTSPQRSRFVDIMSGRNGIRRRQRRGLRNQAAEAGAKSGEAQFGVTDADAAAHIQSIAQSNAQVSAINAANNSKFVSGVASGATSVAGGMGAAANDPEVIKAMAAQQAKAVADSIKDVELEANIPPDNLDEVARRMEAAIRGGNSIEARAYQNMLLNSGSKGVEKFRNTMGGILPGEMGGSTEADLKRNILQNHSKVKDSAADVGKYASSSAGTTIQEVSGKADTWNMSDEEMAGQKTHSLLQAEAANGISREQAKAIQSDKRLYGKLDPAGKRIIDRLAV